MTMEPKPRRDFPMGFYMIIGACLMALGIAAGVLLSFVDGEESRPTTQPGEEALALPEVQSTPTINPRLKPTFTAVATVTFTPGPPVPTEPTAAPAPSAPSETPVSLPETNAEDTHSVRFRVQVTELTLYHGPGDWYEKQGTVPFGTPLVVSGRTADGVWWLVCCMEGRNGWMKLEAGNVFAEGDVNALYIFSVPAPERPEEPAIAPAPPAPGFPGVGTGDAITAPSASTGAVAVATRVQRTTIPGNPACAVGNGHFDNLGIIGSPSIKPPHEDPEINLALRGYEPTQHYLSLWDYPGEIDPYAPRLQTLFTDRRVPEILQLYKMKTWNWACNCAGGPIEEPNVTVTSFKTVPGEVLHVPDRPGGDIGGEFEVMVLYASESQITFKYTREDNMLYGYAIQLEHVCVDPALLALYQRLDQEGRAVLPALRGAEPFGRALTGEIKVVVRDTGSFMDPRAEKDWWQGR
ncbi:MAG: hypothetical protein H0T73_13370 [Ardenticatenales bacterium]|nr:hypothetical protein [Ardenticatenales bacterium]